MNTIHYNDKKIKDMSRSEITRMLTQKIQSQRDEMGEITATEVQSIPSMYITGNLKRYMFDLIVFKKSFSKPCITIYEIKSSKSDFKTDKKWQNYLKYCNKFYFVCPEGVIDKKVLPPEAGLIEYIQNDFGSSLKTVKHTTTREMGHDKQTMKANYNILMSILNRHGSQGASLAQMSEEHCKLYNLMDLLKLDPPFGNDTISNRFKVVVDKILKNQLKIPDFKQQKLKEFFDTKVLRFDGIRTPFSSGFTNCMNNVKAILCLK